MNKHKPTLTERIEQINQRHGAVAYVQHLRREAQERKRAFGQPKNPFKAVPGMETEFQEASNAARYCDFILNEIEKKPRRKREITGFINATADRYIDYLIVLGFIAITGAGIAIISIGISVALGIPFRPVLLGLLGTVAAIAIGAELWKRRRTRK